MTVETQAAFARRLGVNRSTVHRHVAAARVVVTPDGLIDVEASLQRLASTTGTRPDIAARHAAARPSGAIPVPSQLAQPDTAAQPGHDEAEGMDADPDDANTPQEARKARYKAIAMQAENNLILLERDIRRGRRHPLQAVRHEATGLGATLRAELERLVDQTAPRIAVAPGREAIRALVQAEIAAVKRVIRTEFTRSLRRIRKAAKP